MTDNYDVNKEECVGHIQKRLGTALRKLVTESKGIKLADGKGVSGYKVDAKLLLNCKCERNAK